MLKTLVERASKNSGVVAAEIIQDDGATQEVPGKPSVRYFPKYSPAQPVLVPPSVTVRGGSIGVQALVLGGKDAERNIEEMGFSKPVDMTLVLPNIYEHGGLDQKMGAAVSITAARSQS